MSTLLVDELQVRDIRFPTSDGLHGSDAMNPDPDYSCAYATMGFAGSDLSGNGLTFTIGRGNDLCVAAIESLAPLLRGITLDDCEEDPGLPFRRLVGDSQYRWLGPDKGVVHLAAAALNNTVWDLLAKRAGKPLWAYVADMPPEQFVAAIDFRHIGDLLSREEALERLRDRRRGEPERRSTLLAEGYPAYTTAAGWLGYSDDEIVQLLQTHAAEGWTHFKIKVGANLDEDRRRCALFREVLGDEVRLSVDANQVWGVGEAIDWIRALEAYDLYWVEEPTHPDDVLGHATIARAVRPVRLATGEHAANQVIFKQLLQSQAIGFCQIDACRLAGVNEVLAVMLMADKVGVPVCPHAGGVGLCEYVQHLSMIDYLCISGRKDDRVIEHGGQLHAHYRNPIRIQRGHYLAPTAPGYSADLLEASRDGHTWPDGAVWQARRSNELARR